jgi:hypothetical protein
MLYPAELRVRISMFRRYRLRGSIGLIGRNDGQRQWCNFDPILDQ